MIQQTTSTSYQELERAATKQARTNKLKLTWGLICLIGPGALIILSIILYAIANFVFANSLSSATDPSIITTLINVVLFVVGALATLTLVPGIVVGTVLLATRKG